MPEAADHRSASGGRSRPRHVQPSRQRPPWDGDPRVGLLLALGDDELVIGHRHAQWTGIAPHLEEDLAFSSIAQDEMGHALVWYRIAAELTGTDVDGLALGREPAAYRHAILCERPNRDWGYTVSRQYCYDLADDVRLAALATSAWAPVAEATGALRREERYHLLHAHAWLERLAGGPAEARVRLREGLRAACAEAGGLFEELPGEEELVAAGVLPVAHAELRQRWHEALRAELGRLGLEGACEVREAGRGGRRGRHSPDFAEIWEELTGTYRAHPGASW